VILETDEEEEGNATSLYDVVDSCLVVSSRTNLSSPSWTFLLLDLISKATCETFSRSWETWNDDEEGRWRWSDDDGEMEEEESEIVVVEEEEIEKGNERREDANARSLRIVEVVQV